MSTYAPSTTPSRCSRDKPSLQGELFLDIVTLGHDDAKLDDLHEFFFLVEKDKRQQDVGGLLHIVGSGTPNLVLSIQNGFCPTKQKNYLRRTNLGIVRGEIPFLELVNYAPLYLTEKNTTIDRAIYKKWMDDMITQARVRGVLREPDP